jgi:hypothetical protein
MNQSSYIGALTARTYELIGRIVTKAAELEFAILFFAALIDQDAANKPDELLKNRQAILNIAKKAIKRLADSEGNPKLLDADEYFAKIYDALADRDGLAHGLIGHKDKEGIKSFHPKKARHMDIDDASLESILQRLDKLIADTYVMRGIVWNNFPEGKLIQLGMRLPPDTEPPLGTTLG